MMIVLLPINKINTTKPTIETLSKYTYDDDGYDDDGDNVDGNDGDDDDGDDDDDDDVVG